MSAKNIVITIPEPCSENWNTMAVVDDLHRHCKACDRVLTDFSKMTDLEIILLLRDKSRKICGRFRTDQLNKNFVVPKVATERKMSPLKWLSMIFFPVSAVAQSPGNYLEISITDQNNRPIPHAVVVSNNSALGGNTDDNGYLKLYFGTTRPDSLKIHCVGYSSKNVSVKDSGVQKVVMNEKVIMCNTVEIASNPGNTLGREGQHTLGTPVQIYGRSSNENQNAGASKKKIRLRNFFHRIFHPRHKHN